MWPAKGFGLAVHAPAALSGRWDWSESVWYLGSWWRKHFDSEYWCLVTDSGELMYQDDIDWFDSWGYDLPWPEQGPRTRTRSCTLKPNVATLHQDDPGFVPSPGASGSAGPGGGLPAQGSGDEMIDALINLQEKLGMSNRWDKKSFRSQLRKTIKRLCEREKVPFPEWWEGDGLSTHQYKMKAHQFTNDLLNRKLNRLNTGPVTGLPAQGTGSTPATTPVVTPATTPRGANDTGAGPSATQTIIYMMQNMLDDLAVMHPGIQDEVRAAFGSPRMPAAPNGSSELPAQGNGGPNGSDSESSSSSSSPAVDPRLTRSEPPNSPRRLPEEEPAGPEGLPANGTHEAAEEPGPAAAAEAAGNEVVETSAAAVEEPSAVEMEVNSSGPSGLPAQGMNGSWIALSEVPTEESINIDPNEL